MTDQSGIPGLAYRPGWLTGDEQDTLLRHIDDAPWSDQLRRRVQHYGHRYEYRRRSLATRPDEEQDAPPLPVWAVALATRIAGPAGFHRLPDQVIVNEYLPGQGIAAHIDCLPCFGPVVAAVSLGSASTMDFTSPDGGTRVPVRLEAGSLCVMAGPARHEWRHAIAARLSDPGPAGRLPRGRRVSVTFRTVCR